MSTHTGPDHAPSDDTHAMDWPRQERAFRAWRDGEAPPSDDADARTLQQLYAALAEETLPALPADFAANTVAAAERAARARRSVARFRRALLAIAALCYLPAMLAAAATLAADALSALWHQETGGAALSWTATLTVLAALSWGIDALRTRNGERDRPTLRS